jgi:hypothetical protein
MSHCGELCYVLWATTANLVVLYGPLQIWLWATAADLVMRYGPLRGMKPYSINLYYFCTMGHSAGYGYVLWAMAQGLVIRHGLLRRIYLRAISHDAAFGYALWAIAQTNYLSTEPDNSF